MSMCVAQIRRPASKIKVHSSHSVHQFGRTSWSMKSQWCSPTWQEANLQEKPPMSPMSSDEEKNQKAIEVNEVDWVIVGCKSFKPLWKSHMDIGRGRSRRRWTKRIMERRIRKEVESEWPHHKHSKTLDWVNCWMQIIQAPLGSPTLILAGAEAEGDGQKEEWKEGSGKKLNQNDHITNIQNTSWGHMTHDVVCQQGHYQELLWIWFKWWMTVSRID